MSRRARRQGVAMLLAIRENCLLKLANEIIDRTLVVSCQYMQRAVGELATAGELEFLVEITFRDMIGLCNVGNRHPGADRLHVSSSGQHAFLLKSVNSFQRGPCGECCATEGQDKQGCCEREFST